MKILEIEAYDTWSAAKKYDTVELGTIIAEMFEIA